MRTFLGMMGWCRLWIYNCELLVNPLYALITERNRDLQWIKEATRAFDQLKKALMPAPALGLPDVTKPFFIFSHEKQGIALGILAQDLGPYHRAVTYFSKQLDAAAKRWPGCLRAAAAVVMNIQEAHKVTLGQMMTVLVSHTVSAVLQISLPMGQVGCESPSCGCSRTQELGTEEQHNNGQEDGAARNKVSQVGLDWSPKSELFLAGLAQDTSGDQGRDATSRWAEDSPFAVVCQWQKKKGECDPGLDATDAIDIDNKKQSKKKLEFLILKWIFLPTSPAISIYTPTEAIGAVTRKGQNRIVEISGTEPADISVPV
ncbi:hypothetical protein HGM15179_021074 [Zosterops borbonicus]|uniref:Reverse transcriptase/retrotransposon-derived protein RNase H-like domain-containing protein n=1 Tax=Zosterops borbonicus TaxID=364589 RepID=A0A8K1D8H8_9PASS|nr:hypothetical protein HGM15179_021074 [Zosterops borbonicus]